MTEHLYKGKALGGECEGRTFARDTTTFTRFVPSHRHPSRKNMYQYYQWNPYVLKGSWVFMREELAPKTDRDEDSDGNIVIRTWLEGYNAFHANEVPPVTGKEFMRGFRDAMEEDRLRVLHEERDEEKRQKLNELADLLEELGFEIPRRPE